MGAGGLTKPLSRLRALPLIVAAEPMAARQGRARASAIDTTFEANCRIR